VSGKRSKQDLWKGGVFAMYRNSDDMKAVCNSKLSCFLWLGMSSSKRAFYSLWPEHLKIWVLSTTPGGSGTAQTNRCEMWKWNVSSVHCLLSGYQSKCPPPPKKKHQVVKTAKLNEPLRTAYMRNPRTDFFRFETTLYLLVRHPSLGRGIEITNRVWLWRS